MINLFFNTVLEINGVIFHNIDNTYQKIRYNMKKLTFIFALVAMAFTSCDDGSKGLAEEHDSLMRDSDSIQEVHAELQSNLQALRTEYQSLSQELAAGPVEDSTWLENLAQHEVLLQKHEGMLAGHEQMIQGHDAMRNDFNNLSNDEKRAQLDEMKNVHDQIEDDHGTIRSEQETMMDEHKNIRENWKDDETTEEETTMN